MQDLAGLIFFFKSRNFFTELEKLLVFFNNPKLGKEMSGISFLWNIEMVKSTSGGISPNLFECWQNVVLDLPQFNDYVITKFLNYEFNIRDSNKS